MNLRETAKRYHEMTPKQRKEAGERAAAEQGTGKNSLADNPHYHQAVKVARAFQARDPLTGKPNEPLELDCAFADTKAKMPTPCGLCGAPAWFKPSVGRFVCGCGAVQCAGGVWRLPR